MNLLIEYVHMRYWEVQHYFQRHDDKVKFIFSFPAPFPSFNQDISTKNDASVARRFAAIALFIVYHVKKLMLIQSLQQDSVIQLR